jgi:hypothetical protein
MQLVTATKNTTKFFKDVMEGLRSSPKRLDSNISMMTVVMNCSNRL